MRTAAVFAAAALLVGTLVFVAMFGVMREPPPPAVDPAADELRREVRDLEDAKRALDAELAEARRRNEELVARLAAMKLRVGEVERTVPSEPLVKSVVGAWDHEVVGRDTTRLTFTDDGVVHGPKGLAVWTQRGSSLELHWKNEKAPGGEWIDTCTLSADGDSYLGENQNGSVIRGKRRRGE